MSFQGNPPPYNLAVPSSSSGNPPPYSYNLLAENPNLRPHAYNSLPTVHNPQTNIYNPQPNVYNPQPNVYNPQPNVYNPQPNIYNPQPNVYNPNQYSFQPLPGTINLSQSQRCPPGISPELWNWFNAVDEDGNGQITANELQKALINTNWTPFNSETCRLMIGMFDADRNGTIDINEFTALWKYIQEWKACFDSFDTDRSGSIDIQELNRAFKTFGYNLSMNFCTTCIRVFDRRDQRSIKLDDFIQCCVMLKVLSTKFIEKDQNRSGIIGVSYEEFLKMALDNTIV